MPATPKPSASWRDLILFRDGRGQAGWGGALLHRGTTSIMVASRSRDSLLLSRLAVRRPGRLPRAACEPEGGLKRVGCASPYPVNQVKEGAYGLIFAYMGPPEKIPVLPRYTAWKMLEPGELIEADDSSIARAAVRSCPALASALRNVPDAFHSDSAWRV